MNKLKEKQSNYFIQEHLHKEEMFHGGVGNRDIEQILKRNGFRPIEFPFHHHFSLKAKVWRAAYLYKVLFSLPAHSLVFFQAPLYAKMHKALIKLLLRLRPSLKVICFITDINGLKDGDSNLLEKEKRFFKKLRNFIVHNEAMRHWLASFHPAAKVAEIEFFDLLAAMNSSERRKKASVAFAGYLGKSKFIFELGKIKNIEFHVYGEYGADVKNAENVHYHGAFPPGKLPEMLKGSFGLVWDGDAIDGLAGIFGEYNQYISPNKLSLYMVAGLPVIAHTLSGSASLIKKYGIGFTVDSLHEVEEKINALTEDAYQEMRRNCVPLAERISRGGCLEKAFGDSGISGLSF